jgi:choice-of-anchor A domain-containing protein
MSSDFADIWAGRESPDTGKQVEPDGHVALTFDAPVNPGLVLGGFMPQESNCGLPIRTATRNWQRAWSTVVPALGAQQFPRDFNVVVLDAASGIADSGGPIAAGGKVTLRSFSVNQSTQHPFALISSGQVDLASGSIRGNVAYGLASSIPGTVSINGGASLSAPLDIQGGFANLRALSQGLSDLPATGTATLAWSTLTLSGSEPRLNVFDVDANLLSEARSVAFLVPSGATVVVNIAGSATSLSNVGFSLGGASRNKLLWNAAQAQAVTLSGLSLPGSLLAPGAAVAFGNGNLQGTLVARSLSGGGAFQHYPLDTAAFFGDGHADLAANTVEIDPAQPLKRGCKYAFVIVKAQPLTQDGQCLATNLTVPFHVAKLGSAAGRELEPKVADAALGTLRRFSIRDGINTPVAGAWARYASRLRLGAADLVAASNSVVSGLVPGGVSTFYQQQFHGVPVFGHGYFAHSKDGNLRAALGKVAPGLTLSVEPSLSEASARDALASHLGLASPPVDGVTGLPLEGTLEIYAASSYPNATDFKLVWRFSLATMPTVDALARVDALTGQVTTSDPRTVPYLDPAAVYLGQTDRDVSTLFDGPRRISAAAFRSNNQDEFALSSGELEGLGTTGVVLYSGSAADTDEDPGSWPFNWPSDTDPTWASPLSQRLASVYWASQTARAFGDSLALEFDGSPWLGLDGSGETPVKVWYDTTGRFRSRDGSANAYFYGDIDSLVQANFVVAPNASTVPADLEVLAHEQFHGMVFNGRKRAGIDNLGQYRESGSIGEALADIFGIATVHAMTPEDSEWACMAIGGVCERNVAIPLSVGMPTRYLGPKYFDFSKYTDEQCKAPETDRCGQHTNSTVVSHWAYLLSKGSGGPLPDACNVEVLPLADTIDQSLGDVVSVVFQTASSQLVADATFADLRDATVAVAEGYLGDQGARKIEAAWSAVGVGGPSGLRNVEPPDGAIEVDPWYASMQWSSPTDGPWDLVISEDPTFATAIGSMQVSSAESSSDESFQAYASAALSPNRRYYWRVKKHGAADDGCWLVTRSFDTAQKEVEVDPSIKNENGYYQTGFLGEFRWGLTGFYHDDLIRLSDKREADACGSDTTKWSGSSLAFGDSFDALYERFGVQSFGGELAADKTYYFYVQPTWESTFTGQLEKGICSEFRIRKQHLGSFQALRPLGGSLLAVLEEDVNRPEHIGMMQQGDANAFAFTPSDGAVSYELTITTTDAVPMVIYDVTRSADHCAIGHLNNEREDDGVLRWWMTNNHGYDAKCDHGEMDAEPVLLDTVHTSDLRWSLYAIGADGERRSSWHSGDEQSEAGISADNRYFNWVLAGLPPKVGDRLLITAGFQADVSPASGGGISELYDFSDVESDAVPEDVLDTTLRAVRYEKSFHFPAGATVTVSPVVTLLTSPPAPIMNGVRVWYRRDNGLWNGPAAVWRDDDLSGLFSFDVPAVGATLEMVYLPMEFEWGGAGRDRIASTFMTHLVSTFVIDAAPMPEPAKPQRACSAPPGAPVVDAYYRFDGDTNLDVPPCSIFKLGPLGLFGFSWSDVPGAVKYRIKMTAPGGLSHPDVELDRNAARCNGTTCSYQTVPPYSPALGCPVDDSGTVYLSGYYFFISAIDSCGQEGPAGAGAEGYLGPQ